MTKSEKIYIFHVKYCENQVIKYDQNVGEDVNEIESQ